MPVQSRSQPRSQPIRVAIVDRDPRDRIRLADLVARHACFTLVGLASSVRDGFAVISAQAPELILVAPQLADGRGVDLISRAVDLGIKSTILLSTHRESAITIEHILGALDKGQSGTAESAGNAAPCRADASALPSPLTLRETEVLQSLTKGLSFGDIAQLLAISPHTVTAHVRKIYQKLSVNSRGEAIFEARQLRIID